MNWQHILTMNSVALACVVVAGCMAINHVGGWGWFLLIGAITTTNSYKKGA